VKEAANVVEPVKDMPEMADDFVGYGLADAIYANLYPSFKS
jgi:hypothetical protein